MIRRAVRVNVYLLGIFEGPEVQDMSAWMPTGETQERKKGGGICLPFYDTWEEQMWGLRLFFHHILS